jgi:hypothetical protein
VVGGGFSLEVGGSWVSGVVCALPVRAGLGSFSYVGVSFEQSICSGWLVCATWVEDGVVAISCRATCERDMLARVLSKKGFSLSRLVHTCSDFAS